MKFIVKFDFIKKSVGYNLFRWDDILKRKFQIRKQNVDKKLENKSIKSVSSPKSHLFSRTFHKL